MASAATPLYDGAATWVNAALRVVDDLPGEVDPYSFLGVLQTWCIFGETSTCLLTVSDHKGWMGV